MRTSGAFTSIAAAALSSGPAILTAVNALLILNDPPYGTERSYNALRLALALAKVEGTFMRVFLYSEPRCECG